MSPAGICMGIVSALICLKYIPVSLAVFSNAPNIPLVVVYVVSLIAGLMPVFMLLSFWLVSGLFGIMSRICDHVRRPLMAGMPRRM